ncbi:MAG: hypothetical protein ABIA08_01720 [bacterium]
MITGYEKELIKAFFDGGNCPIDKTSPSHLKEILESIKESCRDSKITTEEEATQFSLYNK